MFTNYIRRRFKNFNIGPNVLSRVSASKKRVFANIYHRGLVLVGRSFHPCRAIIDPRHLILGYDAYRQRGCYKKNTLSTDITAMNWPMNGRLNYKPNVLLTFAIRCTRVTVPRQGLLALQPVRLCILNSSKDLRSAFIQNQQSSGAWRFRVKLFYPRAHSTSFT